MSDPVAPWLGASAQRDVAEQNVQAQRDVNATQLDYYRQLLGEGGKSVLLPWYTGDYEQKRLFADAQGVYDATGAILGTPQEQAARYQAAIDRQSGSIEAGNATIDSIYNGTLTQERINNARPVAAARTAAAAGQKQSVMDTLAERLSAISASQARAGYVGGGTFINNQLFNTSAEGRRQAVAADSAATYANAEEERQIRDSGQALRLSSLDLPAQRAQQAMQLIGAPTTAVTRDYQQRLAPFEFFRRAGSPALNQRAPIMENVPSAWQIAATSMGQNLQTAGNAYLQQQNVNAAQAAAQNQAYQNSFNSGLNNWQGQYMSQGGGGYGGGYGATGGGYSPSYGGASVMGGYGASGGGYGTTVPVSSISYSTVA